MWDPGVLMFLMSQVVAQVRCLATSSPNSGVHLHFCVRHLLSKSDSSGALENLYWPDITVPMDCQYVMENRGLDHSEKHRSAELVEHVANTKLDIFDFSDLIFFRHLDLK